MRNPLLLAAIALSLSGTVYAAKPQGPSRASIRYHDARNAMTVPSASLSKVRRLIKGIKPDGEDNERLSSRVFNGLSYGEKFTYVMIHGEDFSQNCADIPVLVQEETKIFRYVPGPFDDTATWSDRQRAFLKNNRNRVVESIRKEIRAQGRVGTNFKYAVQELKAVELIPDLVVTYNRKHTDHDILTALMQLMDHGKYAPFLATPERKKLYSDDTGFDAFLPATPANQRRITNLALQYYRSTRK